MEPKVIDRLYNQHFYNSEPGRYSLHIVCLIQHIRKQDKRIEELGREKDNVTMDWAALKGKYDRAVEGRERWGRIATEREHQLNERDNRIGRLEEALESLDDGIEYLEILKKMEEDNG